MTDLSPHEIARLEESSRAARERALSEARLHRALAHRCEDAPLVARGHAQYACDVLHAMLAQAPADERAHYLLRATKKDLRDYESAVQDMVRAVVEGA